MNVTIEVPQDLPAVVVTLKRAAESGAPRQDAGAAEYDSWSQVFNQAVEAGG